MNLEAEISRIDYDPNENISVKLGGDYYLTQGASLGAAARVESGDELSEEGISLELRGRYNHGSKLGFELSVARVMPEDSSLDDETIVAAAVTYRL